jgi:hypothetical protein
MTKTYPLNTAIPDGGADRRDGDNCIRRLAKSVKELISTDHYVGTDNSQVESGDDNATGLTEAAAGEHTKITLRQTTKPTNVADKGFLYTKDVSGATELFYEDEAGNEKQLTVAGKLNVSATEAVLLTDNQTITGVKTFSSAPVLSAGANAGSQLITNVLDPVSNQDAATKKYVDDSIAAAVPDDNAFGSWASKNINQSYTAASDGFVLVSGVAVFHIETPVGTTRISGTQYGPYADGACCPVKKGNTWKVKTTSGTPNVFWLPIGA